MYDFETIHQRKGVGSHKWNGMYAIKPDIGDDIVPLSVADMEFATPPEVIEAIGAYARANPVLGYTGPTQAYFDAVIGWMQRRHGWSVDKEWIVPTPGVVTAFFSCVTAYTQPGEGVIVMPPVYGPFYLSIERAGRTIARNTLVEKNGRYEIDFADLEAKAKDPNNKLLLFCSPHNPVGRVWEKEELEKVTEICMANDVLIISDEIHFDLMMPGYKHTVFATLSEKIAQNCVVCTAPSKTFNLAGLLTSNIVIANPELREKFKAERGKTGFDDLNIFGFVACETVYTKCEKWLDELLAKLDENRKLCEDFIAKRIPAIKVLNLEGTYLQWWDCRGLGMDAKALEQFMVNDCELILDEGYIFGECAEGYERINLACPTSVLQAALERLEAGVKKL